MLLSLYNGGKWQHSTASGTSFNNEKTNLIISGLTQTKHFLKLLQCEDRIDSGLLPRFIWILLKPCTTDIDQLGPIDAAMKDDIISVLVKAYNEHQTSIQAPINYILRRNSAAYESFKLVYR